MTQDAHKAVAADLLKFIDASPTPFHCVATVMERAKAKGFQGLDERASWQLEPGTGYFVSRGDGSIILFRVGEQPVTEAGFRIIGAHTDSPNLRLKPRPGQHKDGYLRMDVEVYGGAIVASWADRDLSMAGRVVLAGNAASHTKLIRIDRPLCRIPTVAIHLNRKVNEEGLKLDKHKDIGPTVALWDDEGEASAAIEALIAEAAGASASDILGYDMCLFDTQAGSFGGATEEFLYTPRLDNQAMCHAGLLALLLARADASATSVVALFDHEEVGSGSARGADGPFLRDVLGRICGASPGDESFARAIASSFVVSADMAHAVHPSRGDLHDGQHMPRLNGGPVIKTHVNQRYATDAETGAMFRRLCRSTDVPVQEFAMRGDMPCGSTIGPITAAGLGIRTVDVGNPMLSMHSVREMAGSRDPAWMTEVMTAFLNGA